MKKLIYFLSVLVGIYLITSCEYQKIQPDPPIPQDTTTPPPDTTHNDTVKTSFKTDIQGLFTSVPCYNGACHNGSQAPDLRVGKSYASLMSNHFVVAKDANASVLYTCLLKPSGKMKQYYNAAHCALIKKWIDEGALNN